MRRAFFLLVLFVAAQAAATLASSPAHAAVITVTTHNDEINDNAVCSLREAIRSANNNSNDEEDACTAGSGADTIVLQGSTYNLTKTGAKEEFALTGDLNITNNSTIAIKGNGSVIDGQAADRVFLVRGELSLSDLTVRNGLTELGGAGITNVGSGLTLKSVTVKDNKAKDSNGGGIRSVGSLTVIDSVIQGNETDNYGGGIYVEGKAIATIKRSTLRSNTAYIGGGIFANSPIRIEQSTISKNNAVASGGARLHTSNDTRLTNSTVSGNHATGDGGGLGLSSDTRLSNVTIADNSAGDRGGGLYSYGPLLIRVQNTLIGDNTDVSGSPDCHGTLNSFGYNLVEDRGESCFRTEEANAGTDIFNVDPKLGPLADNGGATETHALLSGSPAIDKGNPDEADGTATHCEPKDQRAVPRPVDGNGNGKARCDIGAYEKRIPSISITDASVTEGNQGTKTVTLTVTLSTASADTVTVQFATQDGTAVAPADYQAKSGTKTFAPGDTSKPIAITVNGDTAAEPDETFKVKLSNPSKATILDDTGVATIVNND